MNILITGSSGFIGKRLIEQLKKTKEDHFLCLIDKKNNGINILDYKEMDKIFGEFKPEIVVHLAAELSNKLIPNIKNNVIAMKNIAKLCKKYKVKKLIFSSSAAVYGNNVSALEKDYLQPINTYGCAKKYCEKIIRKSNVPYIILRFSNVYGKGGKGIITRLLEDNKPTITSPLHYTRDFCHVQDICEAIIKSINSNIKNETFNISTGKETMLHSLQQLINKKVNVEISKKKEIKFSCLNNNKAILLLKWKPKITIEKGTENYESI